jgi:hypothetical protein
MNLLKRLFGGASPGGASASDSGALIYYVRGHKCGAISRLRINRSNDMSRNDDDVLFVRKVVVDNICYGQVEVELTFDNSYREASRAIRGGEFVTAAEWHAQQQAARKNGADEANLKSD